MRRLFLSAAVLLLIQRVALASEPADISNGTKVMPKLDALVVVGSTVMDYTKFSSPWIVQKVRDDFLWVGDERKGWVRRSHVVTIDQAPAYYTQRIEQQNDNVRAYKLRAVAWLEKGELNRAIADYGEVLRLGEDPVAYHNRGNVWKAKKDYDKAIADYDQVIRLQPNVGIAYSSRGVVWALKKDFEKALADYAEAMRLDPARHSAYSGAAWIRATCPDERFRDAAAAVELAVKACSRTGWTHFGDLDTLAAAYAESGNFESAIKCENRAIDSNPHDAEFVAAARKRLALYQSEKPYRDE